MNRNLPPHLIKHHMPIIYRRPPIIQNINSPQNQLTLLTDSSRKNHISPPAHRITYQSPPQKYTEIERKEVVSNHVQGESIVRPVNVERITARQNLNILNHQFAGQFQNRSNRSHSESKPTIKITSTQIDTQNRTRGPSQFSSDSAKDQKTHKKNQTIHMRQYQPINLKISPSKNNKQNIEVSQISQNRSRSNSNQNIKITIQSVVKPSPTILFNKQSSPILTQQIIRTYTSPEIAIKQLPPITIHQQSHEENVRHFSTKKVEERGDSLIEQEIKKIYEDRKRLQVNGNLHQNSIKRQARQYYSKQPKRSFGDIDLDAQNWLKTDQWSRNEKFYYNSKRLIDEIFEKQTNQALLQLKIIQSKSLQRHPRRY